MDRHDRIVYWNKRASRVLGWSPEEVLGKMCYDVLAGRDVFGNLYCMRDCPNILSAATGVNTKSFLLDVKKKGSTARVQTIVRAVPLPAAGPSFEVLMHFLEASDAAIDNLCGFVKRPPVVRRRGTTASRREWCRFSFTVNHGIFSRALATRACWTASVTL